MTTSSGSLVVRRQLGRRLRRLRADAGKTIKNVVDARLMSQSSLQRIEAGKTAVKIADVWALCRFYGADGATTDELGALANGTSEEVWWEEYPDIVVPDWFGLYISLQATASVIRAYHPNLVPGVLQTARYARGVISADERLAAEVVDQRVEFRLERQRSLFGRDPEAKITAILGAGALAMVVDSPGVMAEQIDHLRALAKEGSADVRVIPWAEGAYPMRGPFTLLDFDDPDDPTVAYAEVPKGARYMDRPEQLEEYTTVWDMMLRKSSPIERYTP